MSNFSGIYHILVAFLMDLTWRLIPSPPALVDKMKQNFSLPSLLNASIDLSRVS